MNIELFNRVKNAILDGHEFEYLDYTKCICGIVCQLAGLPNKNSHEGPPLAQRLLGITEEQARELFIKWSLLVEFPNEPNCHSADKAVEVMEVFIQKYYPEEAKAHESAPIQELEYA